MDIQTNTHRQTQRHAGRWTARQGERQTFASKKNLKTNKPSIFNNNRENHMSTLQTDGQTDRQKDTQKDLKTVRQIDIQTDRWTDKHEESQTYASEKIYRQIFSVNS